jgi:hypothetical protein
MTLTVKETKRQRYIRRIAEDFGYSLVQMDRAQEIGGWLVHLERDGERFTALGSDVDDVAINIARGLIGEGWLEVAEHEEYVPPVPKRMCPVCCGTGAPGFSCEPCDGAAATDA